MALSFHPRRGTIVYCDFTTGFIEPEMVKKRPVIVISGKENGGICTVVPISTKAPDPPREWHYLLPKQSLPNVLQRDDNWIKCDMVTAAALKRLDRILDGRNPDGSRRYIAPRIGKSDMAAIEMGIIEALCLKHLTIKTP
jgi:uncharacterized protein YifN (PemK superfamily)